MHRVHLEQFEGPLDLLLFFIRRDELDVHDIPIAQIADEYLEVVRSIEAVDLDAAADFVYTAALLIQIKARMLMPRPDLDEDGQPIDPRKELVDRLLEYVRFKEAAGELSVRFDARSRLFVRGAASDDRERLSVVTETTYRATLFDLVHALGSIVERAEAVAEPLRHEITRETFAIDVQRAWVMGRIEDGGTSFRALVTRRSKPFVIVTFLAILDLAQRQAIRVIFGIDPEDFAIESTSSAVLEVA
ncbi:segregation and condensation protein A [Rubrivirga sp.]|uniref:segregation and condensation protein A n=1 Tax=Rubrivirga sp. TaxID=1885344 RepID=UPI003C748D5D